MDRVWMLRLLSLGLMVSLVPLWRQMAWARNRYYTLLTILAALYPLGKVLQAWLIGPGWVRWYLSDVGWTSFVALAVAGLIKYRLFLDRVNAGVHVAFMIGVAAELWQMSVKQRGTFTGAGDWIDLIIFILMYGLNLYLIALMRTPAPTPTVKVPRKKVKRALNHR